MKTPIAPTFREALRFWLKLGFVSFGGPAGQIAIMHRELVERARWISERRFLHALNYCMLLPGPEAQQLATYIGWLLHGVRGGSWPAASSCCPRWSILIALSWIYMRFGSVSRDRGDPRGREARRRGHRARRRVAHRQPRAAPSGSMGARDRAPSSRSSCSRCPSRS